MHSEHANLVKFKSADSDGFQKASSYITLMAQDAPKKAADNWKKQKMAVGISPNPRSTFEQ